MKKLILNIKQDYRHLICYAVTLISLVCGFLFPNALPRLAEVIRDLVSSILYYLCNIFGDGGNPIYPYIIREQEWKFAQEIWKPITILPHTFEEFLLYWGTFLKRVFNLKNISEYLSLISDLFDYAYKFALLAMPIVATIFICIILVRDKHCTDRNKKSLPLRIFEKFLFTIVYPIIAWCKDFTLFLEDHHTYITVWLVIWSIHFNAPSVCLSVLSYYFYFISSWDIFSIYTQLLKLQTDITPVVRFIPGIIWAVIAFAIYEHIAHSMAFNRMYYFDRANKAFVRKLGNITTVYGEPGAGKTKLITALSITEEVRMFDDAENIMLTRASQFPNFPWQNFVDFLNKMISEREIVDVESARQTVKLASDLFDEIYEDMSFCEWQEICSDNPTMVDPTFNYDYDHYRTTYNDELKIHRLYDALESYAAAYVVFSVKTTLIFANYSIRVDSFLEDYGNMPFRDNNFFNRPTEYQDAYSLHAHIFDFDILRRLGKQMISDNPNARLAPCGVIVVSEIDKEFKNSLKLKEVKADSPEANQKNDLHDACLMMIRHAVVIDYISFVSIIADLQRPEAWGANGRELGQVYYISDKSETIPALPFFSSYWLFEGIYQVLKSLWDNYDKTYSINRSDTLLFIYICRNVMSFLTNYYDRINGKFGVQTLNLEYQSGRMDGEIKTDKFRILSKVHLSNRYRTDCLASIFDTYEPNTMHIDDFKMYAGELAAQEERDLQNSYFQNDIKKMKGI